MLEKWLIGLSPIRWEVLIFATKVFARSNNAYTDSLYFLIFSLGSTERDYSSQFIFSSLSMNRGKYSS